MDDTFNAACIPMALVFPPVAALLFDKLRGGPADTEAPAAALPLSEWIWKALLIGVVVYPVLFFGAGYFETASSNFVLGLAVTAIYFWRITRRPQAAPQAERSLAAQ